MILKKIKEIIYSRKLDIADKLCEIEKLLPKKQESVTAEFFGAKCEVRKEGNAVIFDGSSGCEYADNPRLKNKDDLYYEGCGCTWGIDLDGKRYWKRYSPFITDKNSSNNRYSHLRYGDIIEEKARIKKIVIECLNEL